jgi:AcrR family transcriptional regulator
MKRARKQSAHRTAEPTAADVATRRRLLEAARQLFAECGFAEVSVRDICREANANVALVSYYFGDKRGLYLEIIDEAVAALAEFNAQLMQSSENASGAERLSHFVRRFVERVLEHDERESWVHRLMEHELNRPMPEALARFGTGAIAPRVRYLGRAIAEILDCPAQDPIVTMCVTTVHGLCLVYARLGEVPPVLYETVREAARLGKLDVPSIAEQVAAFALAGVRGMKKFAQPGRPAATPKGASRKS